MDGDGSTTGDHVRAFREAIGLSQAQVAEAMHDAGFQGFYPQTVLKVEKGQRSLKLEEGVALASILAVSPTDLVEMPRTSTVGVRTARLHREIDALLDAIQDRTFEVLTLQQEARTLVAAAEAAGMPATPLDRRETLAQRIARGGYTVGDRLRMLKALVDARPETAVAQARRMFELGEERKGPDGQHPEAP